MKRLRAPFCAGDASHSEFNRKKSKCTCGSALMVACGKCKKSFSYAHIKGHEQGCIKEGENEDEEENEGRVVRFAMLQSDWALADDDDAAVVAMGFEVPPRGQIWDGIPRGYRGPTDLRVYKVADPSMPGQEWMDSYDAVFAHVAADRRFELVRIFDTWQQVRELVMATSSLSAVQMMENVDVLVIPNWVHDLVLKDGGGTGTVVEWMQKLSKLELECNVRIFPPLDYSTYFAFKDQYYRHLVRTSMPMGIPLEAIPTTFISATQRGWKDQVRTFAATHGASAVALKRSVSERRDHVHLMETSEIESFSLTDRGANGLAWLAQPKLEQFQEHNEIRLYVVGGKVLWGATSNFHSANNETDENASSSSIALFSFGRDRRGGEWDARLIPAVERLVEMVSQRLQTHARHFLRVDLIKKQSGAWYINELEPFGNAFLHFEVVDDGYELFPTLVDQVKRWMREL